MAENPLITTTTNPNPCIITTITNSRRTLVDPGSTPSVYLAKYSLLSLIATAKTEIPGRQPYNSFHRHRRHRRPSTTTSTTIDDDIDDDDIDDFVQGPVRPVLVPVSNGPPLQTITDSPSIRQLHESNSRFASNEFRPQRRNHGRQSIQIVGRRDQGTSYRTGS